MIRYRGRSAGRQRAMPPVLLALALLLQACAGAGSGMGSPPGNQRASVGDQHTDSSQREAPSKPAQVPSKPSGQQGDPTANSGNPTADATLSSSELALVYHFILDRYVDFVDHAALVQAANSAVRDVEIRNGALPLDTAPLDYAPPPAGNPDRDWVNFARAYDAVVQKHPERSSMTRPDRAALRQMLASLGDNHSLFIEPDEYKRMNETGYSGIGVRVSKPSLDEAPVVIEVFQNSPAAEGGLKAGDRLIAVDDRPTAGQSITEVVSAIRGTQGSPVKLTISRGGQPPLDATITRAPVDAPRVEGAIRGNVIGILRVRTFADGVPEAVQQVLTQGRTRGARAWVLDLRGNAGGSLAAVARVAANFVENRAVGISVDRAGNREPINGEGRPAIPRTPLVVLVDKETASGAEILAAAIKEYQIAPVVGTTTAGNVGIAVPRQLPDGSAVQLTIRRMVTPSGGQLDKVGVQPDISVELTVADLERGDDPQLARALELLVARIQ